MADYTSLAAKIGKLIPERVPEAKKAEFARGFARYCDLEDKETFELLSGKDSFSEEESRVLEKKIASFETFIRRKKGLDS